MKSILKKGIFSSQHDKPNEKLPMNNEQNPTLILFIHEAEPDVVEHEESSDEALTRITDIETREYHQEEVFFLPVGYVGHINSHFTVQEEIALTEDGNLKSGYYRVSGKEIIKATEKEYLEYRQNHK